MTRSPRAFALVGAAALAALVVAGCGTTSSSSSNNTTISGKALAIVISAPHDYQSNAVYSDIVDAEQLAFATHKSQVTKYKLADVVLHQNPLSDNARESIEAADVIAYLGEIQPGTSDQTVGITNALGMLQVSPTDTALELGQSTPAVSGAPKFYFQQWSSFGRTFARLVPTSAQEAQVQADEIKSLGASSLYIAQDRSDYGGALADALRTAAHKLGIPLTNTENSAGAVFYAGTSPAAAVSFYNRAATLNSNAKLFGSSVLDTPQFSSALSSTAAGRIYVTTPGFMPKSLPPEAKQFDTAFKKVYKHEPTGQAIFGFEAMSAVIADLAKLGNNANSRADVVKAFLKSDYSDSVLGSYSINASGNTSLDAFVWNKVKGGTLVPFKAAS